MRIIVQVRGRITEEEGRGGGGHMSSWGQLWIQLEPGYQVQLAGLQLNNYTSISSSSARNGMVVFTFTDCL